MKFIEDSSWVILNEIEAGITAKIEAIGIPLKQWDIKIYRGILTGFNEAFIITGDQKDALIKKDPKSAEIIRPILRGRDIKRYNYEFANLWLINTHNGIKDKDISPININDYPAIKDHLDQFFSGLAHRTDKGSTPYNLRNCAYMEDFYRQKIVWGEISDRTKFAIDLHGNYFNEATSFFMVGESLSYIVAYLNSKFSQYYFSKIGTTTGVGTIRWKKFTIEQLLIPKLKEEKEVKYEHHVKQIIENIKNNKPYNCCVDEIDALIYGELNLSELEIQFIDSQ